MRVLAEATLTLMLFTDASRIDIRALRREFGLPARLLGLGLPLTIVAGMAVAVGLLTQLTWPEALVLAIVLAPTDAALGQQVVTDRRLPVRIRQGLNVESGLNDGICVPLLFIVLAIAEAEDDAITVHSAVHVVLDEIGWGLVGGVVAGVAAAVILRGARRQNLVADHWVQVIPLAGAALSYGIAVALGGSGFIAAFVAGLVFGVLERAADGEVTFLVDSGGQVLNAVTLIVFGAVALGPALHLLDWRIALYAVLSLTVVRMVPVALALDGVARARADGRLRRLVRSPRPRVDRLRADRARGGVASSCRATDHRRRDHRRALGAGARPLGGAAHRRLCALVRRPVEAAADGERRRARASFASAGGRAAECETWTLNWTSRPTGVCDHLGAPRPRAEIRVALSPTSASGPDAVRRRERAWRRLTVAGPSRRFRPASRLLPVEVGERDGGPSSSPPRS